MSARNNETKGMNYSLRRGSSPMSRVEDTQNEFFALKIDGLTTPRTTNKGSNNKSYHFTGVAGGNSDRNTSSNTSRNKQSNNNTSSCKNNNTSSEKVVNSLKTDNNISKNMQILVIPASN